MKIHITLVGGQPLATMPIMATRPERVPYVCSKGSEGTFATYHPMNGAAKEKCEGYNIPTIPLDQRTHDEKKERHCMAG